MVKQKKIDRKGHSASTSSRVAMNLRSEASCASKLIQSHEAVLRDTLLLTNLPEEGFEIKFDMNVALPSRAKKKKETKTGVRSQEQVVLRFPKTYPFHAPIILLRPDFNKSLPHINPIVRQSGQNFVSPCIYDGPLNELLHQEADGMSAILNQLSDWLAKAAIDDLIDPSQGWEPIRRDNTFGWMAYDLPRLRSFVQNDAGSLVFRCKVWQLPDRQYFVWVSDEEPCSITPTLIMGSGIPEKTPYGILYQSLVVFLWADSEKIINRYLPEDIENLDQFYQRAKDYNIFGSLQSAVTNIGWAFKQTSRNVANFPFFVIICVRRPYALIGDDSSLELIPYVIQCKNDNSVTLLPEAIKRIHTDSPVFPLGHRHKVTKRLLQRMSGIKTQKNNNPIVHVGCGSVGSKIAMHLARSGHEPFRLIDNAAFSPHNVARHALTSMSAILGLSKATLLAEEIRSLRIQAEPTIGDIIEISKSQDGKVNPLINSNSLIIESTGSTAVRDMLASLPDGQLRGRLFHAALYEQGKVGIIAIEGTGRNPNVNDLVLRFWNERASNAELQSQFSSSSEEMGRQEVGLGCGSHTMVMPDSRISLFTAGMAQRAIQILDSKNDVIKAGELWIGILGRNQMSTSWEFIKTDPTTVLTVKAQNVWQIRVLDEAIVQINEESKAWGDTETGGVLIGRICLYNRSFNVARVLEAPPDSTRSHNSFVLGIEGLRKNVQELHDKSGGTLTYVGTWHSHPRGGSASSTDMSSL